MYKFVMPNRGLTQQNIAEVEGTTPEAQSSSAVVMFFERGNNNPSNNYRPITFLSHVSRVNGAGRGAGGRTPFPQCERDGSIEDCA
ncbi:hypothetical protein EVAR_51157_1 [Eumeta japonica]|uniref:Uncharacterized protein n=1 Tax=Eumeta variegata TaxID=151549 RepID=A0A4C1XFP6_EUMVA|nr:hypothetical protein EVAR_51157_1 [Eumeta japonica]